MRHNIFDPPADQTKPARRGLFLFLSVLFHSLIVLAVIAVPLLTAEADLPTVRIVNVFAVAPPAPQPPMVPKGKPAGRKIKKHRKQKEVKPQPPKSTEFLAPPVIPDEIKEEPLNMMEIGIGLGGGGDDSVPGAPGWGDNEFLNDPDGGSKGGSFRIAKFDIPKLIKRIAPQYPMAARKARIEGVVLVEAVTDIYGRVEDVRIVQGHPLLRNSAIRAIRQWIYEPYIINGISKPVKFTVSIRFTLSS